MNIKATNYNINYNITDDQYYKLNSLLEKTNKPTIGHFDLETVHKTLFDHLIEVDGNHYSLYITGLDIGYFAVDENGKFKTYKFAFINNGNFWDAVIELYENVYLDKAED
ncbi:MAG: hypothetical protein J6D03_07285 [Clostridia bacterium]|nr:hypothetical protein [Clostridia bacterium]